ncbi:2-phosphosulfolactate phosphatase [Richelia intracellularis HH01]|uniref:Probable 2-phosphosulfolactate phosphatase n=1 Tax=Richelia intracellularis HH01 TaxID=1165094 RepID=M1X062_9NOST|nr:2-phosphosulfolactate phosphatase family protein [Richelia intracellularis]CCH68127.1 2-phosphosulfolactate phosphatase [Richelia intracellularis HH01]HAE05573.1 2-phosphosulfolactate phosphatase family protein [Richelia sp.]
MNIFIYHTPELTPTEKLPECAIVVDVLRATTTIAKILDSGGEAIQVFDDLDLLIETSKHWMPEKLLRAGERNGLKIPGFDLGNSPLDFTPERVKDKRLFMSTTNGTRALQRVQKSQTLITAAFVNLSTVVKYLLKNKPETIWVIGSGWEGSFSLEDTACAGAVAYGLVQQSNLSVNNLAGNDEVYSAIALYTQWQDNLVELLHHASHGKRLLGLAGNEDLRYCAQKNILDVLPMQKELGVLKSCD